MALKWPADWNIINIEGGADWLRICKTKYFFWGCGMIKFWYGNRISVVHFTVDAVNRHLTVRRNLRF